MVMPPDAPALIQIKPEKRISLPSLSAALGMAAAYYGYPLLDFVFHGDYFLLGLLLFFAAVIGFLRVLCRFPGEKVPARIRILNILVIAAAVGFSLGIAARRNAPGPVETGLPPERITAVSGILREDPRTLQGGSGLGILELRGSGGDGGLRASANGRITVFFPSESIPGLKEFGRGSEIYADGVFVSGGRGPLFRAYSVHIVKSAPALEQFRTSLRMTLLEKFQSRLSRPLDWGPLASALLLGVRDDLDTDLAEGFRNSGCSHVLALSGMHLAILSAVLAFLLKRPLGIRWASLSGAVFIAAYVFVAGSQPSLIRAAIMYLLGTFALWGFLKAAPLSLLGMAFIIQLVFQSETGVSYSFILSYLALGGILTLGETIRSLFRGRLPAFAAGSLSASIGAFIVSAPAVALFFGTLKPIGIIAGLFVAPLSSLFMILALAALAVSFLPFPLFDLFDIVLVWLYRFLEWMVSLAGRVPGFTVTSPVLILVVSIFLWILILFVQKKDAARRNSIASFD